MATIPFFLLSLPFANAAFTWSFQAAPQQCANLSIQISGSGTPPYRALILPFGPSPLANNVEARRIVDQPFPGSSGSLSFQLKYPANSQFVAVVSDATGFGSGGTSVAAQVTSSSDSSCFSQTTVQPDFTFSIEPPNQIVQCQSTRLWWDPSAHVVQGTPKFLGVIPGGQSFSIPQSAITNITGQGTGFSWTPSGSGNAGSALLTVGSGTAVNNGCLNDNSPSSTPGNPAGGSYPTSSTGSSTGGSGGGGGSNTGAIVGGVVGGAVFLIAVILVLLFFRRRSRLHKKQQGHKPVDLLHSDEGDEDNNGRQNELPQYYQPEPFMVPDPTVASEDGRSVTDHRTSIGMSEARPLSGYTSTSRSGTPDLLGAGSTTSGGGRKGLLRPMRPVNIIQHDDAGPSSDAPKEEDPETIELPPAYTNIRSSPSA
ncbi:hypothetical protein BD779DRAFT_1672291 [Infundibulicybe gibba]|nr:hypothetical protein BD779DRAFT_1672291 [Infundibulicybe gibba]